MDQQDRQPTIKSDVAENSEPQDAEKVSSPAVETDAKAIKAASDAPEDSTPAVKSEDKTDIESVTDDQESLPTPEPETTTAKDSSSEEEVESPKVESDSEAEGTDKTSESDAETLTISKSELSQTPPSKDDVLSPPASSGRDTAILSASSSRLRRLLNERASNNTARLSGQREIIFVIRGMVERVVLSENLSVFLGRTEPGLRSQIDIDLTPYGALDRGVSRVHAKLHLEDDRVYVTDLGSTNGTYLAGKQLEPNKPEAIRKGDELLLGRLAVQVMFR